MAISDPKQVSNQRVSALHVSSISALVVHTVDQTGAFVSPGAGSTQVSVKEILTSSGASVMDSTNNAIGVTIRAGSAAGTEYSDGDTDATPNGGGVFFMNGSNTMRVVSATTPLPVSGTFSASTIVSVAAVVPGVAATNLGKAEDALHASGDVGVMALGVRKTSPTDLSAGGTDGDYVPLQFDANGQLYVAVNGGVAVVGNVIANVVTPMSSAAANSNSSALVVRVAGGVSSGVDFPVRALLSSTRADNPVDISTGQFSISSIAGVSIVRPEAGSTWAVRPLQSSAADLQMTATPAAGSTWAVRPLQSSAADLQVTATPAAGSTFNVRPLQSSQGDLRMTAYQSSRAEFLNTVYQSTASELLMTATIGTNIQSTAAPSSNSSGLVVRQVIDAIQTAASTAAFGGGGGSTSFSIQSSAANLRAYVTGYSITSTNQTPWTAAFYSSGTMLWPICLAAISSAVTGANLAVGAPAYLFRTAASEALSLRIDQSSRVGDRVGVSYFIAP